MANALSAGYDSGSSPNRPQSQLGNGGYYGNRPQSYVDGQGGPPPPRMRYNGNRVASDGAMRYSNGNGTGVYGPQHGYHASHDTVHTNGSDSTGPWANSTDPSSENSSIDQATGAMKSNGQSNGYGPSGNGYPNQVGGPIMEEGGSYGPQNGYGGPVQQPPAVRRPIPLGNTAGTPASLPSTARPEPEKKKGWLKRRFSKKD